MNSDGFQATRNAWLSLLTQSVLILCFLHGFIRSRDGARRLRAVFPELAQRVWDAYRQTCYEDFIDQVTVLQWWTEQQRDFLPRCAFEAVMKLCSKAHAYALAYDHPGYLRTSNMLDRLLQKMDR